MEDAPFRPGDVIAGKYQVERLLGEGGMGVVVAARHLELEQRVAVKFLLPEIAKRPDAAERFRREARAAVKIRSEHVARVLDVGTAEHGVPYMVMEYLEGGDLGHELRTRGALPIEEAVGYLLEACEAVAEAHAAGIVHRDLKPANLFLASRADGSRLVKVLDFGISKSVTGGAVSDLSLTNTSALIGSPLYMSPEQMHSAKNVDARTDIWALGVILYQTLARRPPYVGDTIPQLCHSLLNETPPPLSSFRSDVPPELERTILGALEKDREKRHQTVAVFARALAPFAPNGRVHAERAARVLGLGADGSGKRESTGSSSENRLPARALGVEATVPSSPDLKPGDRTLASWGRTGDGARTDPPARARRRWFIVGGAAVTLLLLAAGIGLSWRSVSAQPVASAPAASTLPPVPASPVTEPSESANPSVIASSEPAPLPKPSAAPAPRNPAPKPAEKTRPGVSDFGGRR